MRSVESVIERHYLDLWRYARALSKGQIDAEELVQDCLVKALSRPHFWDRIQNPRAYLMTILHNTYVDGLATRRRRGEQIAIDEITDYIISPPTQIAALELRDLSRAFAALPLDQRAALTSVSLEGMTYQETADQMGIPLGTVMSRISRARRALRRLTEGSECRR